MKRYKNIFTVMMSLLLIIFIGTIMLLNIITPNKKFSKWENRILEQKPKFSFKKLTTGKFTSNYEKYISDQFPLRDFWIGVKSTTEKFLGKKENNGVYLCRDGFLMENFKKPSEDNLKKVINSINSFGKLFPKVNKYFMLIPNSTKILEEKLPANAPVDDELIYYNKFKDSLDKNINFIDIYDTLQARKNEYIYFKTDHHWTSKGAFYSYKELISSMGITPHESSYFNINRVTDEFYGSLYSKSGYKNILPDSIELYIPKTKSNYKVWYKDTEKTSNSLYNMENLNKKDKYTIFLNGNHSLIKINTNTKNHKKLLILKDSYANSLIPFLAGHYKEIYVVDLRYYTDNLYNLINDNHIKDMIFVYNEISFFKDKSVLTLGTITK
ncbi:DHHW family protein [Clostridium rectalis]|uniref:DHHW family protein n=1 Tax=Clostridium rectalis TaxID=2040295 RepID=UPI000F630545|nr:DHHW family protein [Clostridium rectalis]